MRPAIFAAELTVTAGDAVLLDRVDLTIGCGDWINVIGPNGAGKTTLLRALAGVTPCRGRLELFGTPTDGLSRRDRSRLVAHVSQRPEMPDDMVVEHYVLLGRTPHLSPLSAERAADFDIVERTLDLLHLTKLAARTLGTLSGGERQRVAIARAITQEPRLLLLDEPTSALDIGHQQDVLELVDRLRHDLGLTVVSTMHDLTLAAQYGDHIVLLAGGRVVASGPPVQILTGHHITVHYGGRVDVIRHAGTLVVVPLRPPADHLTPPTRPSPEAPDART